MKIHILTLFPDMFAGTFAESIIGRAVDQDKVKFAIQPDIIPGIFLDMINIHCLQRGKFQSNVAYQPQLS